MLHLTRSTQQTIIFIPFLIQSICLQYLVLRLNKTGYIDDIEELPFLVEEKLQAGKFTGFLLHKDCRKIISVVSTSKCQYGQKNVNFVKHNEQAKNRTYSNNLMV